MRAYMDIPAERDGEAREQMEALSVRVQHPALPPRHLIQIQRHNHSNSNTETQPFRSRFKY